MYILGLLQRFGPQHGYQLKKIIAAQLADFTRIKLPTIYYHLQTMEKKGLLSANSEPDSKPEKTVYAITEQGIDEYRNMLAGLLDFEYQPVFPTDGIFYFSDHFQKTEIIQHLNNHINKLKKALAVIEKHRNETLPFIPDEVKTMVKIIFSHHEHHYKAELDWAQESLNNLI